MKISCERVGRRQAHGIASGAQPIDKMLASGAITHIFSIAGRCHAVCRRRFRACRRVIESRVKCAKCFADFESWHFQDGIYKRQERCADRGARCAGGKVPIFAVADATPPSYLTWRLVSAKNNRFAEMTSRAIFIGTSSLAALQHYDTLNGTAAEISLVTASRLAIGGSIISSS